MNKILVALFSLIVIVLIVYAASGNKSKPGSDSEISDEITWVKYDDGLKQAAVDQKYVMAYFWRPG